MLTRVGSSSLGASNNRTFLTKHLATSKAKSYLEKMKSDNYQSVGIDHEQNLDLHVLSNDQIFEHPHFMKTQNMTKCHHGSSIELRSGRNTDAEEFTSQNNYII